MVLNLLQKLGIGLVCLFGAASASLPAQNYSRMIPQDSVKTETLNFVARGKAKITIPKILNRNVEAEEMGHLIYQGDKLLEFYLPIPEIKFGVGYPILEDVPGQYFLVKRTKEGINYHDNVLVKRTLRPTLTVPRDTVFSPEDEYDIAIRCLADVVRAGLDPGFNLEDAMENYPGASSGDKKMYINGGFFGGELKTEYRPGKTRVSVRTSKKLIPLLGGFDLYVLNGRGIEGGAGIAGLFNANLEVEPSNN